MGHADITALATRLKNIASDNTSGSSIILSQVQEAFLVFFSSSGAVEPEPVHAQIESTRAALGHFEVVNHFLLSLAHMLAQPATGRQLSQNIRNYTRHWTLARQQMYAHAAAAFDWGHKTVAVHSGSGTIVGFLAGLRGQNRPAQIVQAESRPVLEGREQAGRLAAEGFSVQFATDMEAVRLLENADVLLLGADKIFDDVFVNKTGSFALSLAAGYFHIPVVVVADSRKVVAEPYLGAALMGNHSPAEVWDRANERIIVQNNYLESIPLSLVSQLVSEQGVSSH